ncbi:retrovirus-related Pol polyprotein from transposon 412 [Trichonephila clavipes]|nr:retrovirus-related Pol polyprotein from transposon 412 [Trichonephila clavipes]
MHHHEILQITAVNGDDKGLYVIGQINNISCRMIIDTGANVSIIREDLARNSKVKIIWTPLCVSLQTVTGDKIQVHGIANPSKVWKYRLLPYGIHSRYYRSLYSRAGFSEEQ